MRFFAPEWLWGLLVLPLLYLAITIDERKRQALFSRFADRKLWHWIVPELEVTHRVKKARYALAAAAFALLALARPRRGLIRRLSTLQDWISCSLWTSLTA